MPWYKSGTVSVAQNSNAVIGTGTSFIANGRVGDAFQGPDGDWYEVTNIASDTAMSVAPNYRGPTNSGGSYALAPMQGYNKDTADALRAASLQVGDALEGLDESVAEAAESAAIATSAKSAAGVSATNAGQSEAASLTYKNAAGVSATNSGQSEAAALTYKNAAGVSATNAGQSEAAALTYKNSSATSEANAAASAATAANLGVGKGFIEGLQMVWLSLTSIQILPGSCFMPNLSRVYKVPSTLTVTPPAGLTGFGHIYVYDNAGTPAAEMVATAPLVYWNTAYQKAGDATRRYVGSVLLSSGAAFNFFHYPLQNKIAYSYGTPALAPFAVLSGGTATTATVVTTASICPVTATHLEALLSSAGTNMSFYIGNEDQATPLSSSNWLYAGLPTGYMIGLIPLSIANGLRRFQYMVNGTGSCFVAVNGYLFNR
jgi:hypothetical protein